MKEPCPLLGRRAHGVVVLLAILAWNAETSHGAAQTSAVLRVSSIQSNGWLRISGRATNFAVITLEASSNLLDWQQIALLQDSEFEFADPVARQVPQRFYRFSAVPYSSTNTWKNQISAPRDYFAPEEVGEWIKFAILTDGPTRVYYANGGTYLFHYDFATTHLTPFTGFDEGDFDAVSLYNAGRKVLLGAVLFPRDKGIPEYGIQFVSQDPLPRELVRDMVELVESTVVPQTLYYDAYSLRGFYMPTFEQTGSIEADRAWFETNGVTIGSPERWARENTCYSAGWALGTLKFFPVTEIETAYADGRLRPEDILFTDAVPAEMPYLAGIISLTASTPNSHSHGLITCPLCICGMPSREIA